MKPIRTPRRQRGATLIIAMVFLLIFAVMAATSMRSSMSSVQAISNMQWRTESIAAANDTIDRILSSSDFATNADGITTPATSTSTTPYTVDINGDSVTDIKVTFPAVLIAGVTKAGPRCIRFRNVPTASLDPDSEGDRGCYGSSAGEPTGMGKAIDGSDGSVALSGSQSICADTQWVIPVRATDEVTNTSVDISQGVSVRVFRSDASNYCN